MMEHASDCAIHNVPAMEPGPCDCEVRIAQERAERFVRAVLVDDFGQCPTEATIKAVAERVVKTLPVFAPAAPQPGTIANPGTV